MKFILRKAVLAVAAAACSFSAFAVVNDITLKNVTPKAGELDIELRSLEQITLTFSQNVNVRSNTLAYLTTPNGQELTSVMDRNQYMKNTVLLSFPDINYYNGDYTLTIKRWSVGDDEWFEDYEQGHSNAEIKVVWTVSNGLTAGVEYDLTPVSVIPVNGSTFSATKPLSTVQITMPGGTLINPDIQANLSCIEARYSNSLFFEAEEKGGNVVFTAAVSPSPTVGGDYTLTFPAGMFGDEGFFSEGKGHASSDISYIYTVDADPESSGDEEYVDWTLKPSNAKLVANANDYTMTWRWSSSTQINTELLSEWKILDSRRYNVPDITFSLLDAADPKAGVTFTAELQPQETYTLIVPEAMFYNATYASSEGTLGMANPQLTYSFVPGDISTGVESVAADSVNARNTVYTAQGIRLYDNATEDQIRNLSPGIYILNGKKIIVK